MSETKLPNPPVPNTPEEPDYHPTPPPTPNPNPEPDRPTEE